jgi:hypothetical protein
MSQGDIVVRDDTLDLVELCQMRRISRLVSAISPAHPHSGASHLNTRSIEYIFAGLNPPGWFAIWYSMSVDTAVVCVRNNSFSLSSRENGARYPIDP